MHIYIYICIRYTYVRMCLCMCICHSCGIERVQLEHDLHAFGPEMIMAIWKLLDPRVTLSPCTRNRPTRTVAVQSTLYHYMLAQINEQTNTHEIIMECAYVYVYVRLSSTCNVTKEIWPHSTAQKRPRWMVNLTIAV